MYTYYRPQDVVGSITVMSALTRCALLHSVSDLKAPQMNVQYCLILEFMFSEFEVSYNVIEATENICCIKGDGVVDHSNQMVQEILLKLQEPGGSGKTG